MKTLLITNYWYPYNHPGTIRWLNFGRYMDFDVLTQRVPRSGAHGGFKDYTLPNSDKKVFKFGYKLPGIVWGFLALIPALFMRYDSYLITAPPESLIFTAMILKKLGRRVILDMRDSIERQHAPHKFMRPLWRRCYRSVWTKIVAWRLIDHNRPVIYHGYDEIELTSFGRLILKKNNPYFYRTRVTYLRYLRLSRHGIFPDFSHKPKGYVASSAHNVVHLGFKPNQELADEEYGQHSWEEGAKRFKKFL